MKLPREHRCRYCGVPIDGRRSTGKCADCSRTHCCTCGGLKGHDNDRDRRCRRCRRLQGRAYLDRTDRRCTECGVPLHERRDRLCGLCRRKEAEFYIAKRLALRAKTCRWCQAPLPPDRVPIRCVPCQRAFRRLRHSLSRRRCPVCDRLLKPEEPAYCRRCNADVCRIYRIGLKDAAARAAQAG